MTVQPPEHSEVESPDADPLVRETRLRRDRRDRWLREGDMSVGRRLAQIGVLGWIIVAPMLVGLFFGRWIDARLATGVFWTAPLLIVGLGIGGWTAWKWMNAR
ncbi:MAG: AtpZ/AtpI family protein [Pseudorhodobacter sp.]|nr:AtpZ/AtpI family protein [Pseudorhodobacter sp.]